jgi:5-methylcytosine-specific restriction endonuclease McrA
VKLFLARELLNGTVRKGFTAKQRKAVYDASEGLCCGCEEPLQPGWHCDHILPLALNGKHALSNWQGLCPSCHIGKTRDDIRRIAKAKSQRSLVEEIIPSKRRIKSNSKLQNRGFDKTRRRKLNGQVEIIR